MTPVVAALLLALAVPAAPAPKADKGLPKDLVDLIPEDTAAVLVCDVPKGARSGLGKAALKLALAEQDADDPIQVEDFARDAELVLAAQFLIDKGFGDFCVLVRLKDKSGIPRALVARADKVGKDKAPEQIGNRMVYSLEGHEVSFAVVDDRTLMFVLATGSKEQIKETRAAAYGERERPGPAPALRKMLDADAKDDRAVRLYGHHPKKLALSAGLALAPFGVKDKAVADLRDKIVSYRGGIREGDTAEVELRITAKDGDAAKELLKVYEAAGGEDDRFVKELRASAKAVREGDDVVIRGKLTRATIELLATKPNK